MVNLDLECARLGRKIADLSNLEKRDLTNALGVLEEQGLYAFFLYLNSQVGESGKEVGKRCWAFLREVLRTEHPEQKDVSEFEFVKKLELDDLLFARDLLSRALIYALHHLKAKAR